MPIRAAASFMTPRYGRSPMAATCANRVRTNSFRHHRERFRRCSRAACRASYAAKFRHDTSRSVPCCPPVIRGSCCPRIMRRRTRRRSRYSAIRMRAWSTTNSTSRRCKPMRATIGRLGNFRKTSSRRSSPGDAPWIRATACSHSCRSARPSTVALRRKTFSSSEAKPRYPSRRSATLAASAVFPNKMRTRAYPRRSFAYERKRLRTSSRASRSRISHEFRRVSSRSDKAAKASRSCGPRRSRVASKRFVPLRMSEPLI